MITNVFQASILCLYNDIDELTVAEIKEKTQIKDNYMNKAMISLCNPNKIKVLIKQNLKVPKFDDNENIKLNLNIKSNNIRIHLVPPQAKS